MMAGRHIPRKKLAELFTRLLVSAWDMTLSWSVTPRSLGSWTRIPFEAWCVCPRLSVGTDTASPHPTSATYAEKVPNIWHKKISWRANAKSGLQRHRLPLLAVS
jgi:hypothetical protein